MLPSVGAGRHLRHGAGRGEGCTSRLLCILYAYSAHTLPCIPTVSAHIAHTVDCGSLPAPLPLPLRVHALRERPTGRRWVGVIYIHKEDSMASGVVGRSHKDHTICSTIEYGNTYRMLHYYQNIHFLFTRVTITNKFLNMPPNIQPHEN